jgi:hypothetical protein
MIDLQSNRDEIVYSRMTEQVVDAIPDVLNYLQAIERECADIRQSGRADLLAQFDLQRFVPCEDDGELAAVDSSSAVQTFRAVTLVLACALRYGHGEPESNTRLLTVQDSLHAMQIPLLLRLVMELELLSVCSDFTIMDNSFWSVLMEANQFSTKYGRNELPTEARPLVAAHLRDSEGSLFRVFQNPHIVSVSKQNVAAAIAHRLGRKIKDRLLMSLVLEENELLKPLAIGSDQLASHFGIDRQIVRHQEIQEIYKSDLLVTYFRPWAHKPAYRIEFHRGIDLARLLTRLKAVTHLPLVLEPEPQFLVDKLVKSGLSCLDLPALAGFAQYPDLVGPYRS